MASIAQKRLSFEFVHLWIRWTLTVNLVELSFLLAAAVLGQGLSRVVEGMPGPAWNRWFAAILAMSVLFGLYVVLMLMTQFHLDKLRKELEKPGRAVLRPYLVSPRQYARRAGFAILLVLGIMMARERFGDASLIGLAIMAVVAPWLPGKISLPWERKAAPLDAAKEAPASPLLDKLREFAALKGAGEVRIEFVPFDRVRFPGVAYYYGHSKPPIIRLSTGLCGFLKESELLGVLAHELGHHFYRHGLKWRRLFLFCWCIQISMAFLVVRPFGASLTDPGQFVTSLPLALMGMWLAMILYEPLFLAISRLHERQADRWAINATGDPAGCVAAMIRLAKAHYVDPRPSWVARVLSTHPSLDETIANARKYAKDHGLPWDEDAMKAKTAGPHTGRQK